MVIVRPLTQTSHQDAQGTWTCWGQTKGRTMKGVQAMTTHYKLETFGQEVPSAERMNQMARGIASGICGGKQPTFVGFVWYRPQEDLAREVVELPIAHERAVA